MPKPKQYQLDRIRAVTAQLSDKSPSTIATTPTQSQSPSAHAARMAQRPPITCHVLDTMAGRPAASIPVTLTLVSPYGPSTPLSATTDGDGRVTVWKGPVGDSMPLEELFRNSRAHEESGEEAEMVWALRFDTKAYWEARGVKSFFPEVEIKFLVRGREEHYHVPLLLGPFNYTTYRGS